VSGSNSAVTWQVNGVAGGSQTTGLISSSGTYSAPFKIAQPDSGEWRHHCAMCHGDEGDGKGDLAVQMKLELKDWRIRWRR
jgi:hypothetical protein